MTEHARNFMIGLATILGMVAIVVLLLFFGELRLFAPPQYEVSIHMTMAAGMREGSPIELNGVRIGRVEALWLDEREIEFPVRVTARIQEDRRIPRNVVASVDRPLLGGTSILQLVTRPLGPDEQLAFLPDDGTGELVVVARGFIDEIMAELDERTQPLLDSLEHFNELSRTYTELGANLNALVGEFGPDDEPLDWDEPSIRAAVAKLNSVLDEASHALQLASTWLDDEQLHVDFRHAVTSANALIETATDTFAHYSRLAESLEGDANQLVQGLLPIADELAVTLQDVRQMTRLAVDGPGTIAQLLTNPDLYESLLDASIRLERALAEAQLLIQKFQAEGVPIRW